MASNPVLPPPPPPPPPLFPAISNGPNSYGISEDKRKLGEVETKELEEDEFITQVSNLVETFLASQVSEADGAITLVITVPLKRMILQNGPMCGLVALAEAFELLRKMKEPVCPNKLLQAAKDAGFTKQGEMFSLKGMKLLAEMFGASHHSEILPLDDETEDGKGLKSFQKVIRHLVKGLPVLFPYDADYNHSPSLRNGHAAHWAVVHGIVCRIPQKDVKVIHEQSKFFKILKSTSDLLVVQPISPFSYRQAIEEERFFNGVVTLFNYETSYVIAHQGKSLRTALWKFSNLCQSNQNLREVAPKIRDNQNNFICEDIIDGLCSKVLLLK